MLSNRWMMNFGVMALTTVALIAAGCEHNNQKGEMEDLTRTGHGPAPQHAEKDTGKHESMMDALFGPYADSGKVTGNKQATFQGMNYNSLAVNTADVVVLEKVMPQTVAANETFDYMINVYNTSDYAVSDVVVTEYPASNFQFASASPAPSSQAGGAMVWNIPSIGPKDSTSIKVTGTPTGEGTLKSCATVTYVPRVCVSTEVVSPALELTKMYGVPEKGIAFSDNVTTLLCDPVTVVYTVSNPGSGSLSNVQVSDTLPAGLETMDGSNTVSFNVDSLAPGQERKFQAKLKPTAVGTYAGPAQAVAGKLNASDGASVTVVQPVLAISKSGLSEQFAGRNVTYAISVSNTGNAPADNLVITDTLDANSTFVSATDGGTLAGSNVTWNLGSLAAGASKTVNVVVKPTVKGTVTNTATANAVCAKPVSAEASTKISGIPAILLEVIDIEDPIEVGEVVTYQITATNQGSAEDTNIAIVAELEDTMQYVADGGPTDGVPNGQRIVFAPLPRLDVGEAATWRLTVKAVAAGDVRLTVTMDTDQLTRPVMETEATNFYTVPE